MYIVIQGDPIKGFVFHGPFDDSPFAEEWAMENIVTDSDYDDDDWWVAPLQDVD
jgi:hypothetical protein